MNDVKLIITAQDETKGAFSAVAQSANTAVGQTKSAFDSLKSHWVAITGAMVAAWMVFQKAFDYAKLGAAALQTEEAFKNVTVAYGEDADVLIAKMKQASNSVIDDSELMQRAIKGLQQGLSGEQLVSLLEVARSSARIAGIDVASAFDMITTATANQQVRGLKALGIVIDQNKAYEDYAKKLGVAKEALTEMQQSQALANAAIEEGRRQMEAMGPIMENAIEKIQKGAAQMHELKETVGKGILTFLQFLTGQFYLCAAGAIRLAGGFAYAMGMFETGSMFMEMSEVVAGKAHKAWSDLGNAAEDTGNKIKGTSKDQQEAANAAENVTRTIEKEKNTIKPLLQTLAGDFTKVFNDLKKKQQELSDIKFTTGDLVSQVRQTLMDPFDKYNEQVRQLREKEDMAMKLSSDEKIKLLQSVQQQWAGMTGEIKVGDTVWKTAEMTASRAISNIERIGGILEQEKGKQIADTMSLLEQLRSEYDKLKTLESDVLTLKIDTSEFMAKIKEAQSAVEGLHTKTEGGASMDVAVTASGSETLPISDKISQIKDQLGSLATDTSYNLDLSSFTAAANMMYSITSQMKAAEAWGGTDLDWMKNIVGEIEQAMSLSIAREQVAYQKEILGLEELTGAEGSYQFGTSYVPKTGLYRLHKGEQVITARETSNNDNRNYHTVNVNLPSIQVIARDSDDLRALARKIAKPLQQELKRLEIYV